MASQCIVRMIPNGSDSRKQGVRSQALQADTPNDLRSWTKASTVGRPVRGKCELTTEKTSSIQSGRTTKERTILAPTGTTLSAPTTRAMGLFLSHSAYTRKEEKTEGSAVNLEASVARRCMLTSIDDEWKDDPHQIEGERPDTPRRTAKGVIAIMQQ